MSCCNILTWLFRIESTFLHHSPTHFHFVGSGLGSINKFAAIKTDPISPKGFSCRLINSQPPSQNSSVEKSGEGGNMTYKKETTHHRFMIVGLGNHISPSTRHSIGMTAADALAKRLGVYWTSVTKATGGHICHTHLDSFSDSPVELILFKPYDFMNVNGKSVAKTARLWSVQPGNIYLIHDDLELKPGEVKMKVGGSALGHKGVLSCIECLQSKAMHRLRIGIGRPSTKALVVPYVLSNFDASELKTIHEAVDEGLDKLLKSIEDRILEARKAFEKETSDSVGADVREKKGRGKKKVRRKLESAESVYTGSEEDGAKGSVFGGASDSCKDGVESGTCAETGSGSLVGKDGQDLHDFQSSPRSQQQSKTDSDDWSIPDR